MSQFQSIALIQSHGARLEMPDEVIWTHLLRMKDPCALEAIYDFYGPHVYRVALRLVRDQAASEDILQEAFTRLWNAAASLTDSTQLGPLLFTIARRRALDYLRARGARARLEHTLESEVPARLSPTPDAVVLNEEYHRLMGEALESLNLNQRRVIEMAYYDGMSQSEIASRLNQPLGTVKSWSRAALASLRDRMEVFQTVSKSGDPSSNTQAA